MLHFFRAYFRSSLSSFFLLLAFELLHAFLNIANDLFDHAIVLADSESAGNSQRAFRIGFIGKSCFLLFHSVAILVFLVHQFLRTTFPIYLATQVYAVVKKVFAHVKKVYRWTRLQKVIRERLERPSVEQLEKDRLCIVCRMEMTEENAKVLPCGHCIHDECLERWLGQQSKCPVCEKSLAVLLEPEEKKKKKKKVRTRENVKGEMGEDQIKQKLVEIEKRLQQLREEAQSITRELDAMEEEKGSDGGKVE